MKKSCAVFLILCLGLLVLSACGSSGYKTELDWGGLSNAVLSVENESFDGDNIEAGVYSFEEAGVSGNRIPIIWDIYVSNQLISKISDLDESEFKGSVGGTTQDILKLELSKEQYIYIIYNETVSEGTGYLSIKKVE